MKKTISFVALTAIAVTLIFSGCKKGENDPFLTLKTRNARLAQTWDLSSEDYTETQKGTSFGSDYTSTTVYSYDGTSETQKATITSGSSSTTSTTTKTYSEEITFDKDGTYEINGVYDGDAFSEKGNWMWVNANKDQEIKNKEAIILTTTSSSDSDNTYSGKSTSPNMIMVFDKLSSTELDIIFDNSENNSNGDASSKTGTITYTKK